MSRLDYQSEKLPCSTTPGAPKAANSEVSKRLYSYIQQTQSNSNNFSLESCSWALVKCLPNVHSVIGAGKVVYTSPVATIKCLHCTFLQTKDMLVL